MSLLSSPLATKRRNRGHNFLHQKKTSTSDPATHIATLTREQLFAEITKLEAVIFDLETQLEIAEQDEKRLSTANKKLRVEKLKAMKTQQAVKTVTALHSGRTIQSNEPRLSSPAILHDFETLASIEDLFHSEFLPQVQQFPAHLPSGVRSRDTRYKKLSEDILAQIIMKLDGIPSNEDNEFRVRRKESVQEAQGSLNKLDMIHLDSRSGKFGGRKRKPTELDTESSDKESEDRAGTKTSSSIVEADSRLSF